MKIIQPETLDYTVKLTQVEIDIIAHAVGQISQAKLLEDMPHYERELSGFDSVNSRLYAVLCQLVSEQSVKSTNLANFK